MNKTNEITNVQFKDFLKNNCTKVRKRESIGYVELMMDNHKCIEFEGKQYYVPENSMLYSETDQIISDFFIDNFSL